MTNLAHTSLITLAGIAAVTLIDTLGAIASRKLNFNYGWLIILSLLVYTFTAYFISAKSDLSLAFLANCIIGLYDATVGWKLSLALNAKTGMTAEEIEDANLTFRLIAMLIISFGFGYLGFFLHDRYLI
ncbi:MAG: hypothetical protein WAT20_06420 [Ferruginibacter sp.]|nr:hypothetical protein [Chitinophagaceae bacterium]